MSTRLAEQLQQDQLLERTKQRLELSVDAAELGTFYCPMPLGPIEWNSTCKEHFWLPADATIDFDLFYSRLHSEDRERTRKAVEAAVFDRQPYDVEYRTVAPDGRMRWIRAKGRAYYDEAGQPLRFDGITIDISEQKRSEALRLQLLESERHARAAAEQASRLKDQFLATLSHELRTPLNSILGWTQLLRRHVSGADLERGLSVIERNARVQVRLIEDLLDMSRIVSGKLRFDVRPVDLSEVIRAAIESVQPAAAVKSIRIHTAVDPNAGPVQGDPARLQQVFSNLLSNALKFTPEGGAVQVTLEGGNAHVQIIVTDTGIGIAPEFLPHLFERFRQADGSTARQFGGLGLGLALVKSLVEAHGGAVRAESRGEHQGATFIVELPLSINRAECASFPKAQPRTSKPAASCLTDDEQPIRNVKVLVVDDDTDGRELIRRILEEHGAIVIAAASAAEALQKLGQERPEVILSDIGMPQQDGYEFIQAVRQLPLDAGGDTPAVALTAFAQSRDRQQALLAGYHSHLPKPVEPGELIAVVASLAGRVGASR